MTDLTQKEQCKRGCMRWGAGVGLVLALLFWLVFGWGFIASLFLGIILGLVTFVVLSKLMCGSLGDEPMQTASTPAAAAARTAAPMLNRFRGFSSRTTGVLAGSFNSSARLTVGLRAMAITPVGGVVGPSLSKTSLGTSATSPWNDLVMSGAYSTCNAASSVKSGLTTSSNSAPKRMACFKGWNPSITTSDGSWRAL